ncbi:hypothetical protein AAFF_G00426210 [Aldrovandia affinis]|uniref:Ig-like domain-containing protein n=1 Tax=Aldrovandia affinis TaxID=143900 RepID=A0AAD7WIL4_9TELE|nr:hypothetical protein AAFF_G00426210 [Aldrovandia affinis]
MNYSMVTAVLLGVVCVLAKVEGHIDNQVIACKTNDTDAEDELQLDGNEILYVDFKNKEVVFTFPEFIGKGKSDKGRIPKAQAEHQICLNNLNIIVGAEKSPPEEIDPPQSTIYPRKKVVLGKNNILICFVTNFYPLPVKVKWTKNNAEMKEGVTLSRYYPNSDFTFQQLSTLSITPEEGDIYSCSVEHKGLQEPQTRIWEPEVHKGSNMAATAFCGIGLTLGLLGVGVGTFFLIKGNNCN